MLMISRTSCRALTRGVGMFWLGVALLLSIFLMASPSHAQQLTVDTVLIPHPDQWPSVDDSSSGGIDISTSVDKMTAARKMMRDHRYEPAAALLEKLLEAEPENDVTANLLRTCYLELGEKGKAEVLVRRQLAAHPEQVSTRIILAELLADRARTDEAMAEYRRVLTTLRAEGGKKLQIVISSMIEHTLYDSCRAVISEARKQYGDSLLFRLDEGLLLERSRRYTDAAIAYLPLLLHDSTVEESEAEQRLQQLLSYRESSAEVEGLLAQKIPSFRGSLPYLLMNNLLGSGRYAEAMDFALRQDSVDPLHGQLLMRHVQLCVNYRAFAEALKGAELFALRHAGSPYRASVDFSMAAAQTGLHRFADAEATYRRLLTYGERFDKVAAWYELGRLQLDHLNKPEQAVVSLDSALALTNGNHFRASIARPLALALSGEFDNARAEWVRLSRAQSTLYSQEDANEVGNFHLALLDLFEGNLDSAKAEFRRFMVDHPRGLYTNDAITHLIVFTDADSAQDLLMLYAGAEKQRFLHRPDSATALYQQLSTNENPVLAPMALYRMAEVAVDLDDTSRALGYLGRLKTEFADSHYIPYGLKLEAELMAGQHDRVTEVIRIYRHILKEYPFFPFNGKIRDALKTLEAGSLAG